MLKNSKSYDTWTFNFFLDLKGTLAPTINATSSSTNGKGNNGTRTIIVVNNVTITSNQTFTVTTTKIVVSNVTITVTVTIDSQHYDHCDSKLKHDHHNQVATWSADNGVAPSAGSHATPTFLAGVNTLDRAGTQINRSKNTAGFMSFDESLASTAVKLAQTGGASYADVRLVRLENESLQVKKGVPEEMGRHIATGIGVRVIVNGAWGFAGSVTVERKSVRDLVAKALRIAKASSTVKKDDVKLIPAERVKANYRTPLKTNPFTVPLKKKLSTLLEAERRVAATSDRVKTSSASFRAHREDKFFLNSESARIRQRIVWCGGGISATAIEAGEVQVRSYPASFRGNYSAAGYEFFESLDLLGHAEATAKEAVELLTAPPCSSETTNLIVTGDQLALQVHESCGHATELDRVLGMEADFAGTSFLTTDKLGSFQYGSKNVNIVADATTPGGLGTFGYDDEGTTAKNTYLVKEGRLVGYQTSRETAAQLGLNESSGGMRAESALALPLIRMTNINLLPGDWSSEEIVRETKHGLLVMTNKSWSIDDKRLNFQFGTEAAWEIRNGSRKRLIKNATYTGIAPTVWGSCDAVSKDDWKLHGTPTCGKGVPSQTMYVGHGVSTARFRNVRVGIVK